MKSVRQALKEPQRHGAPRIGESTKVPPGSAIAPTSETLHLQRLIGNRAVGLLLAEGWGRRLPADSSDQATLRVLGTTRSNAIRVSRPGDHHELEASQLAHAALARRTCHQKAQAMSVRKPNEVCPASPSPGGRPLPTSVRTELEPAFNRDFSTVRIHDTPDDRRMARHFAARAFTHRGHIWLSDGQRADDMSLIAHELAHVVQQTDGSGRFDGLIQRQPDPNVSAPPAAVTGLDPDQVLTNVMNSINAEMAEVTPLVTRLSIDVPLRPADHALNEVRNLDARLRGDEKALREFEHVAGSRAAEVQSAVSRIQVMQKQLAPAVAAATAWHEANPAGESLGMMNERVGTQLAGTGSEQWAKGGWHYATGGLAYAGAFGMAFLDAGEKVFSLGFHDAATAVSQVYTRGDISWNEGEQILRSAAWRALLTAAITRGAGMATSRLGVLGAEATGLASTTLRYGAVAGAMPGGLSTVAGLGTQALLTKGLEDQFKSPAAKAIWNQGMPQGKDWAIAIPLGIIMGGLGGMRGVEISNQTLVGTIVNTPEGPMQVVTVTQLKLTTSGGKLGLTQPGVMVLKPVGGSLPALPPPPSVDFVMIFDPARNAWVPRGTAPSGLATAPSSLRPDTPSGGGAIVRPTSKPTLSGLPKRALTGMEKPQPLMLSPGLRPPRMLPPGSLPPLQLQPGPYEDFGDLGNELAQTPGSGFGTPTVWSVTPGGVVFATPPISGVPLYVPQGPLPPSSYFTGQPRAWTMSGPLQPNFTPFDVLPGQSNTGRSLSQVRGARGPNARGAAGELHVAELSAGSQREVSLDLPGGLTRRSDVLSPTVAGTVNQEVKNYLRFRGSSGGAREVEWTPFMQTEINRDAMAIYYYRHQPVWVFTDAPPSQTLRQALERAGIPYIVSTDRLPLP